MMRRKRGFTLIELMIVVAVIAILAAIAVPWYGRYAYRARRDDAQTLLLHMAQAEERFYTDYNRYPASAASLGYSSGTVTSEHGYYTVQATAGNVGGANQSYTVTATPVGVQAKDVCGQLSIDSTGEKGPSQSEDPAAYSNGNCW